MDQIKVQKTDKAEEALKIAKSLHGTFFNEEGMEEIKKAVKEEVLYGIFEDEKMIGFITFKEVNNEVVEISWMGLLPDYQSKGLGSKMLEESLNKVKGDYKVCEVKTLADTKPDPDYEKTRSFYRKHGFIGLNVIHPYPGWGERNPCQIFVKFLRN
jgi:ribosomal protein S18 acetylase RimI-like enzyme